jgi:hypothetical protein
VGQSNCCDDGAGAKTGVATDKTILQHAAEALMEDAGIESGLLCSAFFAIKRVTSAIAAAASTISVCGETSAGENGVWSAKGVRKARERILPGVAFPTPKVARKSGTCREGLRSQGGQPAEAAKYRTRGQAYLNATRAATIGIRRN